MAVSGVKGVLASDLDGTIAVGGCIGTEEFQAAAKLRAAGIPLLVVTGRNSLALKNVKGLWDLADEVLFASGAGCLTSADSTPKELQRLSASDVGRIAGILDDFGEDYCILHRIPRSGYFGWARQRRENPDFDSRLDLYASWGRLLDAGAALREFPDGALQFLVIRPAGLPLNPELEAALAGWSVFFSSSPLDHASTWLEIFPAGVNKGSALKGWCRQKGISAGSVLALGNDFNDLPMLQWAGHPRVVGNSPEALKRRPGVVVLPPAGRGGFPAAVQEALRLFGR